MIVRKSVVASDLKTVRVSFNQDGKERVVTFEDEALATSLLVNRRDVNNVNAQCQGQCEQAEVEFNDLAKQAELEYQRRATELRARADGKIKAAQDAQRAMIESLVADRDTLDAQAFELAEAILLAPADADADL